MYDRYLGPVEQGPRPNRQRGYSRGQLAFQVAANLTIATSLGLMLGPAGFLVYLLGLSLGVIYGKAV